jgi:hypothetical protein
LYKYFENQAQDIQKLNLSIMLEENLYDKGKNKLQFTNLLFSGPKILCSETFNEGTKPNLDSILKPSFRFTHKVTIGIQVAMGTSRLQLS